jgi:hypothetical protein
MTTRRVAVSVEANLRFLQVKRAKRAGRSQNRYMMRGGKL